jgi:hypothetical protein
VKKNLLSYLFCSDKFHRIENYFIFEMLKEKVASIFKELWNFLPKKFLLSSQNMGLGSGIRDPESGKKPIPDPVSRGQKAPDPGSGSRSATLGGGGGWGTLI